MQLQISQMTDLVEIREEGVTLQVISEWGPWSPCKQCVNNRGIKTSRGYCRLKRNINSASVIIFISRSKSILIFFMYKLFFVRLNAFLFY